MSILDFCYFFPNDLSGRMEARTAYDIVSNNPAFQSASCEDWGNSICLTVRSDDKDTILRLLIVGRSPDEQWPP